MRRIVCLFILFFCFLSGLSAQNDTKPILTPKSKLAKVACDCQDAIPILLNQPVVVYGPTIDTNGYGNIQEIPVREKYSKYYFEKEHSSAWYLLKVEFDGILTFDIIPKKGVNDYDFLLFQYLDSATFCEDFLNRKLIPIRSNIARNADSLGVTGLSVSDSNKYAVRGEGSNYSQAVKVKKGEAYILVLDNVTPHGEGHKIVFSNVIDVLFSGTIKDEDNYPIKAEITVEDKDGSIVGHTVSDSKTGEYTLHAGMVKGMEYTINQYSDSTFFSSTQVIAMDSNWNKFKDVKTVLLKLKKGKKYPITNINFYPGVAEMVPKSYPTVNALYKLMVKNKHMKIRIEGHVNAPFSPVNAEFQHLSQSRAQAVYDYLFKRGISQDRLSTFGFANRFPLFPNPKNEEQQQQNRRVEIRVISLK